MRGVLVLSILAACGGGGGESADPHEIVMCSPYWGPNVTKCERGCAEMPTAGTSGVTCTVPQRGPCGSVAIARFEGELGCCLSGDIGGAETGILFHECEE